MKIGNINDIITPEFLELCKFHASHYNLNGRTPEKVLDMTICGEGVELVLCNYFGWELANFETMEYDAITPEGKKIEIKHTTKNDKWWNFRKERYDFFIQNARKLDKIVLCYLSTNKDVHLKFIADATSFTSYINMSNCNSGYYYNVMNAQRDGNCIIV